MLGGTIGDLDKGDVFEPVEYDLTAFMCTEYAHGVEEGCELFHSDLNPFELGQISEIGSLS